MVYSASGGPPFPSLTHAKHLNLASVAIATGRRLILVNHAQSDEVDKLLRYVAQLVPDDPRTRTTIQTAILEQESEYGRARQTTPTDIAA